MATRYSGDLKISVLYTDHGYYRTSVSQGGKLLWRGRVNPAPSGFGPGIAYDSERAYDEIARSALAFADDDERGIGDSAEMDSEGYKIRRVKDYWKKWPGGQHRPKTMARDVRRSARRLLSHGKRLARKHVAKARTYARTKHAEFQVHRARSAASRGSEPKKFYVLLFSHGAGDARRRFKGKRGPFDTKGLADNVAARERLDHGVHPRVVFVTAATVAKLSKAGSRGAEKRLHGVWKRETGYAARDARRKSRRRR